MVLEGNVILFVISIISIVLGGLILFFPKLLRWMIGLYFLLIGILGLIQVF